LLLIEVPPRDTGFGLVTVGGAIWDGPLNAEFTKAVAGWDWVYFNEQLCFSGETSGVLCGAQVFTTNQSYCDTDPYGHYECYQDLIGVQFWNGSNTHPGDSGGAWFIPRSDGRVTAKGTESGGGDFLYIHKSVFQDFGTAQQRYAINVVTAP